MTATALMAIGDSEEGRPIRAAFLGPKRAEVRALVVAGQHGDEWAARQAAERLIEGGIGSLPMEIAVIPDANPDGAARRQRRTIAGVDMNRDHVRLRARETRSLHAFVRGWRPRFVIDLHNYPSRRKHLLAHHQVLCWDVCLDIATHPAAPRVPGLVDALVADLNRRGFTSSRYVLVKSRGYARYSTPRILDARNFLALRYEAATVLLEGRTPTRGDEASARLRLASALDEALRGVLRWAWTHRERMPSASIPPGAVVPLGWKYVLTPPPATLVVRNQRTGRVETAWCPRGFRRVAPDRLAALPAAYALPQGALEAFDLLVRHGFRHSEATVAGTMHSVWPVDGGGGTALAALLDERSKCALHRLLDWPVGSPIAKPLEALPVSPCARVRTRVIRGERR